MATRKTEENQQQVRGNNKYAIPPPREGTSSMWQHSSRGVRSPSGTTRAHTLNNKPNTYFYLCSELELGDLEAVASPWGSSQLGGLPAIFSAVRFLY